MQGIYLNTRAHVRFREGASGTLHKVVFEPKSHRITDLVVYRGLVQKHEHVIPIWAVSWRSPQELEVALGIQEWVHYPEYHEAEYAERKIRWEQDILAQPRHPLIWNPVTGLYEQHEVPTPTVRYRVPEGIPFDEEVIGHSSVVRNVEGVVGKVDYVVLERENWEITHLIVHKALSTNHVVIPVSWITGTTPEEIYIRGVNSNLHMVPRSQWQAEIASAWQGKMQEHTVIDPNLAIADDVALALAQDASTALSLIEVTYERGVITLTGTVETEQAHEAADEIARRHKDVVSVVNALEVRSASASDEPVAGALERAITRSLGTKANTL